LPQHRLDGVLRLVADLRELARGIHPVILTERGLGPALNAFVTVTRERALADKERDKREEAMKQQLEALRAIERGILEREEKLRRRTR